MNWLLWRLHGRKVLWGIILLIPFAVLLLITDHSMASQYKDAIDTCQHTNSCDTLSTTLFQNDTALFTLVNLTIFIPLLLGLFWGVPLVAKEYEEGTNKVAWGQGISRTRWLLVSLAWVIGVTAIYTGLLTLLVTHWSTTIDLVNHNRFGSPSFDTQGVVPVAYGVFAVTLGIAFGTWLRKMLPALFLTLFMYLALHFGVTTFIRPHFMPPHTQSSVLSVTDTEPQPSGSILTLHKGVVDASGRDYDFHQTPSDCQAFTDAPTKKAFLACLTRHGYHNEIIYQPASRFWPFQWIEFTLYMALTMLLLPAIYLLIKNRDI